MAKLPKYAPNGAVSLEQVLKDDDQDYNIYLMSDGTYSIQTGLEYDDIEGGFISLKEAVDFIVGHPDSSDDMPGSYKDYDLC